MHLKWSQVFAGHWLAGAASAALAILAVPAQAADKVSVTLISVPAYGPVYIIKELGLAKNIDLDIKVIDDIATRNAALSTNQVQCMLTTLDSTVVARAAGVPVKHVASPLMSYGLDQMVAAEGINSIADMKGKSYAAELGFLNHMWMLLSLKREGMPLDAAVHKIMNAPEASAAFASGTVDLDVTFLPFSTQSLKRKGSKILKTSLTDKTWERGLISDSIACNEKWLKANPQVAKEFLRAWFQAVDWWMQNPEKGNEIIANGMKMDLQDVKDTMGGTLMLNLNHNMGAFGLPGGKPICDDIPADAPKPPVEPSGWGKIFSGPDCEAGYLKATWDIFGNLYLEDKAIEKAPAFSEGVAPDLVEALVSDGVDKTYSANSFIGRVN